MAYWLLLDIGNTHTVSGLYDPASGERLPGLQVRFRTDSQSTADEYRAQLSQLFAHSHPEAGVVRLWDRVERVILSTVVPPLERVVIQACAPLPCLSIKATSRRDFELDLPHPEQLGADRLANVAGALTLSKAPFLIVDAGTATTFCLLDARPAYIGGAIVPGLETSWKALQARAAKLFSVELTRPETTVGRTTESQLQSGVLQGYEALIEGMTDRLLRDAQGSSAANTSTFGGETPLFATGGCIQGLQLSARFRREPDLTLLGLIRYGHLNPLA